MDGVLLDIDDTLVDTRGAFAVALTAAAASFLPHLPPERHAELLQVWRADTGGHYRRYTSGEIGYRDQRVARAAELQRVFGGAPLDDEAFARWDDLFETGFAGAWTAHEEVSAVVDALLAHGVAVGALSNAGVDYQTAKLRRVGLADRLEVLVGVDTLGVGKPHPSVFLEACRRLGTDPARTAYVGDELDVDAVAAVGAGLVGVWVDRPGPRRVIVPPEDVAAARAAGVHVVATLAELPVVLGLDGAQRPTA
ncbi:haloacid dehalogenase [Actinotalea ferrariae CF5-4]|uniref:Haloacid dehalogenase n=1 Tax=Actinotalea ferrariae CF5-4 TaxID=948458 RepID=A0A021W100_9CELL|nr:HAD family hydrolase [Actinotalea ferrariae]EYR65002.1 haloacid dehalogenase [Actinotalea ferrariae CF5-4]